MGADDAAYNYLHEDWLGNVRVTSNLQSHAITYDVAYSPYGELYDGFGSAGSQYTQFAGINGNFWSGVTWGASNRELSDYAGRWLSPDPAMSGWNQYAYPTNPNSMTDPSGLFGINGPGGGCDYQDCGGDDPCAYGFCDDGPDGNPCAFDIPSCWGPDPDMDNTVSPRLPPAATSIFTGEDCVGCYSLGASPLQVLQAVLSGNLYGALQDVGAVPTNGIDCTSGVGQISPLEDWKGSYANCVKQAGEDFSLQNALTSFSPKWGQSWFASTFLSNPYSDYIGYGQHLLSGNGKALWNDVWQYTEDKEAEALLREAVAKALESVNPYNLGAVVVSAAVLCPVTYEGD